MQAGEFESVLHRMADIADALTLPVWQRGSMQIETKPDGSPVTTTDVAVETDVRAALGELFPDDGFVGEEVGETSGTSGRTWIVDGIDGTRAFTTGRPEWSTLIGLVVNDEPIAGMVTGPALGYRWWTSPGGDALSGPPAATPQRLLVSTQLSLADARVICWPVSGVVKPAFEQAANQLAALTAGPLAWPSWTPGVAVGRHQPDGRSIGPPNGAMLVAEGQVDAFVMFGGQAWDHAASAAVLGAAGGQFSCVDGSSSLWAGSGLYSNGQVHDELLTHLFVAEV